ncbi:sensor histidine kinase [Halobacillus litoralis]|uniref:sensor histidine kinase n=1 Tax=Halobacillus litoralis TaxID=45668 RepID=UPI002492B4E9|nr:histidine kinase [Halobacillus litoralis]
MMIKTRYKYFFIYLLTLIPILMVEIGIYNSLSKKLYDEKINTQLEIVEQSNSVLELMQDPGYLNDNQTNSHIVVVNSLSNAAFGDGSQLLILNEEKDVLYTTNSHLAKQDFLSRPLKANRRDTGYFNVTYLGVKRVLVYSHNSITGMYLMVLTPTASISEKISYLKTLMTIFILATVALHILLIFFISSRIANPITKIRNKLSKFEEGEITDFYDQKNKFYIKDELWEIDMSFYKIRSRLEKLIKREYDYKLKLNEAKLLTLQAQINPHFLYNTLETINSIATVSNTPVISELTKSLSSMFRYNTEQKIYVPIKEEVRQVKNYLTVQLIRFGDIIECKYDIDDEILNYKTLKFTFQPIVENCFSHAFENFSEGGEISIKIYKEDDQIFFRITDNGLMLEEEYIQKLNNYLNAGEEKTDGDQARERIGLHNVNQRLKLYFGNEYGVSLQRNDPRGLTVLLNIPMEEYDSKSLEDN